MSFSTSPSSIQTLPPFLPGTPCRNNRIQEKSYGYVNSGVFSIWSQDRSDGRPVHTGIAIFTPTIDLEGNLSVSVRVDKRIISALNVPGSFIGKINNSANIGMTSPEMAALWNEKNPDNPIVLEPAPVVSL